MNKFFICFFSICLTVTAFAQNNVGIGTSTPLPGAVLDLTSPSMGFLVPRTKVALVTTPTLGLVIFDTDSNCFVFYNSSNAWQNLCSPHLPPQSLAFNDSIYFNPNGTVTVVDSNGMAIHTSPNSAWITTGNAGTTAGTNFAGTTDAQDFVLKSNNSEVLRATQAGAVGINTPLPDPTSILDMTSTTRGVLFPALTSAQRDAIVGPAVGLTIYDTDLNVHQFWNGTCWVNVGQTVCSFVYNTSFLTAGHNSDCLLVSNFSSVNDTIQVGLVSGTPSPVILTAVGVPAGVIVSFSNNYLLPPQTSIMTFTALPSAVSGTYTITVLATSGSTVQTLTYTLVVFGFGLTVTPNDTTVASGNLTSGGYISQAVVSIGNSSSCGSTGGTAQLSATVNGPLGTGIGVSFQTTTMPIPGSTIMTINSNCPPAGVYTITVQAQIGVTSSYATYTLTVTGSTPVHVTTNQTNLDISTLFPPGACAGADTVYIDAGVTVCSSNPLLPALTTGNIPAGGSLTIINNGTIVGAGGAGGEDPASLSSSSCPTANGGNGGDAIFIATAITTKIINNGVIGSGGGGGAAGAALSSASLSVCIFSGGAAPGGSGGGGAGGCNNVGGPGGGNAVCSAGNPGTGTVGGTGGATQQGGGCGCAGLFGFGAGNSGAGGNGGNLGQNAPAFGSPGGPGSGTTGTGVCPYGNPGNAGYSVNGLGCGCYTTSGNALVGPTH